MKLKSLLIGSAAVMAVSTGGAKAADAIVMAEPEPMEYVRICDVYGAGFYYVPGTETCLRVGGYIRFQIDFNANGYTSLGRVAPIWDARTETEWGTIRGYGELEIQTSSNGPATTVTVAHAFIEVIGASGTLRLGRTHTPYSRFLGYGGWSTGGGAYGFRNRQEISYTFSGGNGFSAIVALVDNNALNTWATDIEAGVNFAQGWGSIGAIAGFDTTTGTWGAKGVLRLNAANTGLSFGLHAFYTSGAGAYRVSANQTNWSVLGHVFYRFSEKGGVGFEAQWFDNGVWNFTLGADLTPVGYRNEAGGGSTLRIRPEISYNTGTTAWTGLLRFDRNF